MIFEDADLERALDAALFTIFSLNGERCTAGSRIFIQASVYDDFVAEFAARASRIRVGDPREKDTAGRGDDHRAALGQGHRLYRDRREGGAEIVAGGLGRPSQLPARVREAISCSRPCSPA